MYAGSENGENNKPNQAPFTTTSVLCVHFRVKQQLINCTQGKRNYNRKSACKKKNVNNNACATTTETTNARNGTTTRRSLYPPLPHRRHRLSLSLSLSCLRAASGGNKRKIKKNSKKKSCRRCRLPVDATHPQQSFAAAALLRHTPTQNVSCTLCVYRESERLPPTQTRALFLAGMLLLLLACRWRSVHLCTCSCLSPPLSVYLRFICSSLLSSFAES